jgi:hypothetical protein
MLAIGSLSQVCIYLKLLGNEVHVTPISDPRELSPDANASRGTRTVPHIEISNFTSHPACKMGCFLALGGQEAVTTRDDRQITDKYRPSGDCGDKFCTSKQKSFPCSKNRIDADVRYRFTRENASRHLQLIAFCSIKWQKTSDQVDRRGGRRVNKRLQTKWIRDDGSLFPPDGQFAS